MICRVIFFFFFSISIGFTQPIPLSTKSKKAIELYTEADNYRVRGQHDQAINLLNQAIAKDKAFVEAYYRLALVYITKRNFTEAIRNLETALSLTDDPRKQKIIRFDLGESYLAIGEYEKAIPALQAYIAAENQNRQKAERAEIMLRNANFAIENKSKRARYKQRALSDTVNCFELQYFPVLTADQQELIFTRRVGSKNEHDEDLYMSKKDAQGRWLRPESISSAINTSLNEGTCTISADGRKLIFTSCVGRNGFGSCDLFESIKIGDTWTEPVNLGPNVNSSEWESQPSLSADGRILYFVSDRRGGLGRRDIWMSVLDEGGQWTKAVNVGAPINTQFDEISPFVHVNGRSLYFASTGHTGYGGYDLFLSERTSASWTKPKNLGFPINDHEDQFSLFITADGKKGYYSHEDRMNDGTSRSRIFELEIPEDQRMKFVSNYVKGVVVDSKTKKPLQAKIELIDIQNNTKISEGSSDSVSGSYLMVLTKGSDYGLFVNKPGYLFKSLNFDYSIESGGFEPITINIELDKIEKGSVTTLKNIFFDTDKFELKEKSVVELNRVFEFLKTNPSTRIVIEGHTDNVGNDSYNQQLSLKRAQAVYNYLINRGINAERIQTRGLGSQKPISSNTTEEGRSTNRRIEFVIQ